MKKKRFFTFTRGRFVVEEAKQMQARTVRFDMNELARIAAKSVGAGRCVHVEKCPDGMYSKAYIFRMDDGREVIGKVPTPMLDSLTTRQQARLPLWISWAQLRVQPPLLAGLTT